MSKYLIITEFNDLYHTNDLVQVKQHWLAGAVVVDTQKGAQLEWDGNHQLTEHPIPELQRVCTRCGELIDPPAIMCTDCSAAHEPDDLAEHNQNEARDYDGE